jgi:hypothetical protein
MSWVKFHSCREARTHVKSSGAGLYTDLWSRGFLRGGEGIEWSQGEAAHSAAQWEAVVPLEDSRMWEEESEGGR